MIRYKNIRMTENQESGAQLLHKEYARHSQSLYNACCELAIALDEGENLQRIICGLRRKLNQKNDGIKKESKISRMVSDLYERRESELPKGIDL